jgi:hypothetical protein
MSDTAEENLRACLLDLQPLELLSMRLLKAPDAGQSPDQIPREQLQSAVLEVIAYTENCAQLAHRINQLAPIPIRHIDIPEFAL